MKIRITFIVLFYSFLGMAQLPKADFFKLEHKHEVTTVKFSNDGRLACGTQSGEVYIWNVEEKVKNNYFEQAKDAILRTAFSNNGKFLASSGKDKKVHIWDLQKGIEIYVSQQAHKKEVSGLSFSSDNFLLAHASTDGELIVEYVKSHEKVFTTTISKKGVNFIEFAHQSHLLVVGDNEGKVTLYDIDKKEVSKRFALESGKIRCVKFSPNDRLLAIATASKKVFMYDVHLGVNLKEYAFHKNDVYQLDFSPDGKFLATAGLDNQLLVVNLETHQLCMKQKGFYKLLSLSFSFNGKFLAIADYHKKTTIFDVQFLKINPNNRLNKTKTVNVLAAPPKIKILSPIVQKGEKYATDQATIMIEGKVESEDGLFMLLVQGKETKVDENNQFSARVKLGLWDNTIKIKAIDNSKQVTTEKLAVYYQTSEEEIATKGLKRQGVDYALIIGTNEYDTWSELTNPLFDTKTIEEELKTTYGFQTKRLQNPTQKEVFETLREYSKTKFSDQDQLFIFIAGHGHFDKVFNEGYLVCKDSKEDDLGRQTYISHSILRTVINNIQCKHIFLVMDVCFGGTFDPLIAHRGGKEKETVGKDQFILRKMKHKTRQYLTSGGKEYVPDGRPGEHSPFARRIIEGLRSSGGTDGILTISELMVYIDKVSPEPRHGEFGDNEPGSEFLFIKK